MRHVVEALERRALLTAGQSAGHLDASFGVHGVSTVSLPLPGESADMAIQPDDKIVVVGQVVEHDGFPNTDLLIARLLPAGGLDPTFGQGGVVRDNLGGRDVAQSLTLQPDGKILVAAARVGDFAVSGLSAILRYNPDGSRDSGFGDGGVVKSPSSFGWQNGFPGPSALQPDGRIIAAFSTESYSFETVRFNPDGSLDTTFGDGGRAAAYFGAATDANAVSVEPNGDIVMAGSFADPFHHDESYGRTWAIARFHDGSPDETFGSGGVVTHPFERSVSSRIEAIQPLDGGDLVVGWNGGQQILAQLLPDGTFDPAFGVGGFSSIGERGIINGAQIGGLAVQSDGKPLVASTLAYLDEPGRVSFAISRFTADGSLDPVFGSNGIVSSKQPLFDDYHRYTNIGLQSDGRIVVADERFGVQRYESRVLPPEPPVADAGGPYTAEEGAPVPLNGSSSYDVDGGIASYEWDVDYDGTTFSPDVSGAQPDFRAVGLDGPSTRVVALRVTDVDGRSDVAVTTLAVSNRPPQVVVSADSLYVFEGSPFQVKLSVSDPGVDTVSRWLIDWGDGSPIETISGAAKTASHAYPDGPAVIPAIKATAVDEDGEWPADPFGPINVVDAPPLLVVLAPAGAFVGQDHVIRFTYQDVPADTLIGWKIDWGDGVVDDFGPQTGSASHAYAAAGHYLITATARDEDGSYPSFYGVTVVPPPSVDGEGTLHVYGGDFNDGFDLDWEAGVLTATVNELPFTSSAALVKRVEIDGFDGDDALSFSADVAVPVLFDAGDGRDQASVAGTAGDDVFNFHADALDVNASAPVAFAGVESINVDGKAGDDVFSRLGDSTLRASLTGGDGDDRFLLNDLAGGVLSGGAGRDTVEFFSTTENAITYRTGEPFNPGAGQSFQIRSQRLSLRDVDVAILHGTGQDDRFVVDALWPDTRFETDGRGGDDTVVVAGLPLTANGDYALSDAGFSRQSMTAVAFTGVENVTLNGSSAAERFRVTPSPTAFFTLNAGAPTVAPGDRLDIDLAGAKGARRQGDQILFSNRNPITARGFESFNDVFGPKLQVAERDVASTVRVDSTLPLAADSIQPGDLTLTNFTTGETFVPISAALNDVGTAVDFNFAALPPGGYQGVINARSINDADGGTLEQTFVFYVAVDGVAGASLFYNHSAFDEDEVAITLNDLAAVGYDKVALRPGEAASYDNVSDYSRGINGVLVDFAATADLNVTADDFVFRTGRSGDPATWAAAPAPNALTKLRVVQDVWRQIAFTWPDGAIANTWLQVTVLANAHTGLTDPYTFYFGNLAGDTVDDGTGISVAASDLVRTRNAIGSQPNDATDPFDFNRDQRIDASDLVICRNNVGRSLKPIVTAPVGVQSTASRLKSSYVRHHTFGEVVKKKRVRERLDNEA